MKGNNIALSRCYYCGEADTILIDKYFKDISDMDGKVIDMVPCSTCERHMKLGIILIEIDDALSDPEWWKDKMPNPYRTGKIWVVQDEALRKIITDRRLFESMARYRFSFIDKNAAERIGLHGIEPVDTRSV